jgi:hypothetical protein
VLEADKKKLEGPDSKGHFGPYGGVFVGETLIAAVEELNDVYQKLSKSDSFWQEFHHELNHYVGRPSPLYFAERLTNHCGGAKIYLKREDLNHTGAHKVNNTIGQALLAKHMGKPRIQAETGAGQHGGANATVAARLGLECHVYMGAEDIVRQAPNVYRMKLLGANVVSVESGSRTLKDALNEALRDWATNVSFYCLEFSTPESSLINSIYNSYKNNIIPWIGKKIAKNRQAYKYLEESIDQFPDQEELLINIKKIGFKKVRYLNIFNGIVCIHSGFKI